MTAEHRLATLIVDAAAQRQRGERVANRIDEVSRLVIELGAEGDVAFGRFFEALALQLRDRKVRLPAMEELPPSIAPLLALFEASFVYDEHGDLDTETTAARLDASLVEAFGTSPRTIREAELAAEIKADVSSSVADSLRRNGLTPLADTKDDD